MSFSIYGIFFHSGKLVHATKFVTALTVLLVLNTSAIADIFLSANAGSNIGSSTPAQTGSSGTVSDSAGGNVQTDLTIGRTSATFGELKAYSFASSSVNSAFSGVFANTTASFRDDWLFNAPGLTGTRGFVDVKFTIDGTLELSRASSASYVPGYDSSVRASANYSFSAGLNNGGIGKTESLRTQEWAATNGFPSRTGSFLGIEQTYTVPFTYGTLLESVGLELSSNVIAIGTSNYSSTAKADLEHTAKWGGFGAVRDENGNIVTDYSFSSGSGFDYTQGITAVPEPGSCALVAIGAGFFLVRRTKFFRKKK